MTKYDAAGVWPATPNATQAHVVDRARFCLKQRSADVSLTEISRAAHHSPSTLIYQFGSFAGLKDAVFIDIVLELAERTMRALGDSQNDPAALASELMAWLAEERDAAEFVMRFTPKDLATASSNRPAGDLVKVAERLLPSLKIADRDRLQASLATVHQSFNAAVCFAEAADSEAKLTTYLETALPNLDAAIALLS